MKHLKHIAGIIMICSVLHLSASAQFIDDAVRLAQSPTSVSARAYAMGNAFIGVADDFSALHWNPAGLGLLRQSEFTMGLTNLSVSNDARYLGTSSTLDNSSTHLNNIGFALPFPVMRGSLVIAAGYNRLSNYTGALSQNAFNSMSSIQRSLYDADDETYDLAWNLGLEDTLLFTYLDQGKDGWLAIPVSKNVRQISDVLESGSMNQWAFGGSSEIAPNLYAGISFNILTGSYRYERTFEELDEQNQHTGTIVGVGSDQNPVARTDFERLIIDETIDQEFSGWNAKFGLLYDYKDMLRVGLTLQSPFAVTVVEDYMRDGESRFAGSSTLKYGFQLGNEYDVSGSWLFGLGLSVTPVEFARISADVDLADHTELEFDNSTVPELLRINKDIKKQLQSTTNYRFGAEVNIPETGLLVRGGYGYYMSPYKDDPSEYDMKTISFGLGYMIEHSFLLNVTYSMSSFETHHLSYIDPDEASVPESAFRTDEKISSRHLMFSFAYRF